MIGVLANAFAIAICAFFGKIIGMRFNKDLQEQLLNVLGICVMLIGISAALKTEDTLLMVISSVVGLIVGHELKIEDKINKFGENINKLVNKSQSSNTFVEGFVSSTLIFCVGSMAIIGSINAGILGDNSMLFTKAILDGATSVVLASTLGVGVAFSAIPIFIYQGLIVLLATVFKNLFTATMIANLSGVGGICIIAIGLNIMNVKKIQTGNMIPSLIIPVLYEVVKNIF